jgi:hypothetical protein
MATVLPGAASRRPGFTKRAYVIRRHNGKLVAQSWPRRRGKPKQSYQKANLRRMSVMAKAVKRWPTREVEPMRTGLNRFLQENRGVRGTAAIRFRDWQTAILSGRQWIFDTPDAGPIHPARLVQDVSDLLDNLEPRYGSLLTRAPDGWLPTVQCAPGYVLCSFHSQPAANACPPASTPPADQAAGGF